jgi:anti-anti-sigma factor
VAVTIEHIKSGTVTIVTIAGRLDGVTAPQLDDGLAALIAPGVRMVLDMSALDYVSSAGLRVLLKVAKQVKAAKGRLALAGITPTVTKVFEISGFTTIFDIHADSISAAAAIA